MVSILATGANTSLKSSPCFCRKPFATNLALYLAISPLGFIFNLKTHFTSIGLLLTVLCINSQMLFFSIDFNSSFMAAFHLESFKACSKVTGSNSAIIASLISSPSSVIA
ncbi:putative mitochondrial protein [Trifolium repens]|nr:putative mitochondrial protein [Trifolium repens]